MYQQKVKRARKASRNRTIPREQFARFMGHVNKLWQQVYQLMVYLFDDHVSRLQGGAVHSRLCCISVRVVPRVRLETLVAHIRTLSFFPALVARTTSKKNMASGQKAILLLLRRTLFFVSFV